MPKAPQIDELAKRKYWTPGQAARVLGRSGEFWTRLFDAGVVAGYTEKGPSGRVARYLAAASAEAYLRGRVDAREEEERQRRLERRRAFKDLIDNDPVIVALRLKKSAHAQSMGLTPSKSEGC